MKTFMSFLILSALFIFGTKSVSAQKKINSNKEKVNISIMNFSSHQGVSEGHWHAERKNDGYAFLLSNNASNEDVQFVISVYGIADQELNKTADGFVWNRPAGTITFSGALTGQGGNGKFSFERSKAFESFLNQQNIEEEKGMDFFKMFLANTTEEYVLGIKQLGYQPTTYELGKLGLMGADLNYVKTITQNYYPNLDLQMMAKFAIHHVTPDYLEDLKNAGYGGMDPNMVKKFAIHGIHTDYINSLKEVGYDNLDPEMLKKFAIHSIRADYIRSLMATNIYPPKPNDIKKAKIHMVTANFIEREMAKGNSSRDLYDYVKLKVKGR